MSHGADLKDRQTVDICDRQMLKYGGERKSERGQVADLLLLLQG